MMVRKMIIENNKLKHYLKNVYFITGTAYAGKSAMTKMLAEKYSLICCGENYHCEVTDKVAGFEIAELISLSKDKKVIVDTNIPISMLKEISDYNHVAVMLSIQNMSVERFFGRLKASLYEKPFCCLFYLNFYGFCVTGINLFAINLFISTYSYIICFT